MKIVHIQTRWITGGAEENVLSSCEHQVRSGHQVVLIHGQDFDEGMRKKVIAVGAEVLTLPEMIHPISSKSDLKAIIRLTKILRKMQPDIVHTHNSKAGVVGRIAARLAGVPTVIHGIHILPFVNVGKLKAALYIALERMCAPLTDAFISVSPSVRDICIEKGIGKASRHYYAFSAMDVDRFKNPELPDDWRSLLNVPDGEERPPTAVMLAAFEPRKRIIEFIQALPYAFAGSDDWRVLFAGRGQTEAEARNLVEVLGLSENVCFAGFRPDPEAMIALADIGVLTSAREGLPRVVVQFAAAGKPSVISDLPGIGDIVENDVNAIVTSARDVSEAAKAVAALLSDPVKLNRMSAGARQIDVDAWSPARMNEAIDEVYRRYTHAAYISTEYENAQVTI